MHHLDMLDDGTLVIDPDKVMARTGNRRCNGCMLCCKLLPIAADLGSEPKPAGKPCPQQRHGKGCAIYHDRPLECRMWSCQWLLNPNDTAGLPRPDRAHYVIDPMPDTLRYHSDEAGIDETVLAIQVWIDPAFSEVAHDPALRAYLAKKGAEGYPALLRWNQTEATAVFPPTLTGRDDWIEFRSNCNPGFGLYSMLPKYVQERLR